MAIVIRDAPFSHSYLRLTLAAVRKARPGIKTSEAHFEVWRHTNVHGQRWMVFDFDGVHVDGYFDNAYEGRAAGWDAWLRKNGEEQ